MLRRYVLHERPRTDGSILIQVGPEIEDLPCARCGAESRVNICPSDGRVHHHGSVHLDGDLVALCRECCPEYTIP